MKATKSYTVLAEDLGCKLRVKVTPVRSCGMEGKPTASASVKIVENSAIDDVAHAKSNPSGSNGTKNATKNRLSRLKKARASIVALDSCGENNTEEQNTLILKKCLMMEHS